MGEQGNYLIEEAKKFGLIQARLDTLYRKKRFNYSGEALAVSFNATYELKNIQLLRQSTAMERLQEELRRHIRHYAQDVQKYEKILRSKWEAWLKRDLPFCWIWYEVRREKEFFKLEKYQRLMAEKTICVQSARSQLEFVSTLRLGNVEIHQISAILSPQSFLEAFSDCYQAFTQNLSAESKRLLAVVGSIHLDAEALSARMTGDTYALCQLSPLFFAQETEMSE